MGQSVQEFIAAAKTKAREEYEKQRDLHLIELGLVKEEKTTLYSKFHTDTCNVWDPEKQMYCGTVSQAIDVTDEEYEEIKKLSPKKITPPQTDDFAETLLNGILIISLIVGIIGCIVFLSLGFESYRGSSTYFISAGILLVASLVNFAVGKVLLNISNNLHSINSKIK